MCILSIAGLYAIYKNKEYKANLLLNEKIELIPVDNESANKIEVEIYDIKELYRKIETCEYKGKSFWIIDENDENVILYSYNRDFSLEEFGFERFGINDFRNVVTVSQICNRSLLKYNYLLSSYSSRIYNIIVEDVIGGVKIPHKVSLPVIYKKNKKYYLAVFVFFYNKKDIDAYAANRPSLWALADINTGEVIHQYETSSVEFSDAPYDQKYSMAKSGKNNNAFELQLELFTLLDKIIESINNTGAPDMTLYNIYLNMVIDFTPVGYQRFCSDLSFDSSNNKQKKGFLARLKSK